MTTETETEIVKQYLKGLAPDELVALLIDIHGANGSVPLLGLRQCGRSKESIGRCLSPAKRRRD